jgi:MrcB-like, N-terminal domain/Domain of unknown function (DUF3883)
MSFTFSPQTGRGVYLSLNQGTSEFRSNAMRPILDSALLQARAAGARELFDAWAPGLMAGLDATINVQVDNLPVGVESKRRAKNYENANVYAIAYNGDDPVQDDVLRSDLLRVLEMLKRVYAAGTPGSGSVLVASADQSGQACVLDTKLRKAIEDHSMAVARALYNESVWQIDDVSRYRSYDLHLCRKADGYEIHVEVKGTASAGVEVFLTKEEVKHAKSYASTVLVNVHDIQVQYQDGTVVCRGGPPG